ncbi:aminoacyl tRNA synthase complex-interacting multifunctional protein 1 [Culicoides brevitarsis]|uniref:aminoacyl tRNA synthase complex-interacting multifunctional protein 1 n=1 Tax=Culicoides brevitarsis TaxID=469753 RepID=UPI00307CA179
MFLLNPARIFQFLGRIPFRMERIIANNRLAEATIKSLEHEVEAVKNELIARKFKEIQAENEALREEIEKAKAQLISLEVANGKRQIPLPGESAVSCSSVPTSAPPKVAKQEKPQKTEEKQEKVEKSDKPQKEKKAKPAKQPAAPAEEAPIDIRRLDLRVGKIVECQKHPDADGLYLEKIDVGEAAPRTVISGLVKFVPLEEMQNRMVVVLCNLKPVKMRGVLSEGMVMCASTPEKVEVLAPPAGSVPGDLIHCEGFPREPDAQMNPKKKIFETVAPDLLTNGNLEACYKGAKLQVPEKGAIVAQTLKNVHVK